VGNDKNQRLILSFSNSGVLNTYTHTPELITELSPDPDKSPQTYSSFQIVHTPASGFELITEAPLKPPQWIANLKSILGIPNHALMRHLTTNGAIFGVRWQNYNLRFVGVVVEQSAQAECSWPFWRISDADGKTIELVQVWFQRASCMSSPVYCDVRWQPDRGETVSFVNLENAKRGREITLAWRGRVLLQKINPQGRPESSVSLTRTQFIELAPKVCAKLLNTFGEVPTDVQIAEELHISRATFYRYMERYSLSLNEIRDTAVKILIEPATF
jgi:hypothetical protein